MENAHLLQNFQKTAEIKQMRHRSESFYQITLLTFKSGQMKPDWMKAIQSNFHLNPGKGGLRIKIIQKVASVSFSLHHQSLSNIKLPRKLSDRATKSFG